MRTARSDPLLPPVETDWNFRCQPKLPLLAKNSNGDEGEVEVPFCCNQMSGFEFTGPH